jgi:hypothetical protein
MSSDTARKNMYYSFTIRAILADVARRGFEQNQYLYLGVNSMHPQVILPPNINYLEDSDDKIGVVVISKGTTANFRIDEKEFSFILNDPEICSKPCKLSIDRMVVIESAKMNQDQSADLHENYTDWGQEDLFGQNLSNAQSESEDNPDSQYKNQNIPEDRPDIKVNNVIDFRKG